MTDGNIELTRRKILASMGAVGAAGAGAGLGTSALFNDTEEFANNRLTAGELDLKMDWEEHYSFPQIYDDFSDPTVEGETELDVVRSDPESDDYVALPDPNVDDPVVWANDADDPLGDGRSSLDIYFDNTIIEAFPDDATTDPKGTFTRTNQDGEPIVENPCDTLGDLPSALETYNEDEDGNPTGLARTRNDDTYDGEPLPLLSLSDVKPGDYGEFTFSAHLCGNDGYLWLQMPGGLQSDENSVTEPEAKAENESSEELDDPNVTPDPDGDIDGEGELAEHIRTTLWYDDDCNNRINGEPRDLVALAIIDTSESQEPILQDIATAANRFVERLNEDAAPTTSIYAGVMTLDAGGDDRDAVLRNFPGKDPITKVGNYVDSNGDGVLIPGGPVLPGPGDVGGDTPLPHALDLGREYLNDIAAELEGAGHVTNPRKEILLLTDGNPGYGTGAGELLDAAGNNVTDGNGDPYVSDYFDGIADNETVRLPDPNTTEGGLSLAETVLVARDVDGEPYLPGTPYQQLSTAKVDSPDQGGDDADISGDPGVNVRVVATYDDPGSLSIDPVDAATAIATAPSAAYDFGASTPEAIADSIVSDLGVTTGEGVLFRGTLAELETYLSPAADGPQMLDGDRTIPGTDCFAAGVTHCFGLAWWIPEEVGNEIQSDSVSFDLGFYTEQCRNNDNPGQSLES